MNNELHIVGIHHVSVIASRAQPAIDFFGGILGLRLVKKTVHYDEPHVYQLHFSNDPGAALNIVTVFVHEGLTQGRQGTGRINTLSFSAPFSAMDYWLERLKRFHVPFKHPQQRFQDEVFIYFENEDGLGLELVFNEKDSRTPYAEGIIPKEQAIRGFHNVEIWDKGYGKTQSFLTEKLGYKVLKEQGNRVRMSLQGEQEGSYIDVLNAAPYSPGLKGSGTFHDMALAVKDTEGLFEVREHIAKGGTEITFALDRTYYKTLYFETPAGLLFEVSTQKPGFTVDEAAEKLGEELKIPMWFEYDRANIGENLPKITFNKDKFK